MKSLNSSEVAALIPQYWNMAVRTSTVEDIIFFGQITIREMIRSWRHIANDLALEIKDVDEKLKLLRGKGAADIREVAKKYESPEFPQIGVRENTWSNNLEPLDVASIDRKHDATTLNFCGWCKYAGDSNCHYNYHLTPYCCIREAAGLKYKKRRFDTLCFLKEASDKVFDEIRNGLTRERERLIEEKRQTDKKIKFLPTLEKRAEKKPAMSNHRPHDWLKVDDSVVCYVGDWKKRIVRDNFATAKVIGIDIYKSYRYCGFILVRYDERMHTGEYLEGHGNYFFTADPEMMHEWEFEYLLGHPDFASFWLRNGTSEGHNVKRFLGAFAREAVRRSCEQK